jgi:predicted O-methyltransferase YrrM
MLHSDFLFLEFVFVSHPHLINIVEIGTHSGVGALHLGLTANLRGGKFVGFDRHDPRISAVKDIWTANSMEFASGDLHEDPDLETKVIDSVSRKNSFVIFDSEFYKKDISAFIPHMAVGSIFMHHDTGELMLQEWIIDDLKVNSFEQLYEEFALYLNTGYRVYRRKA